MSNDLQKVLSGLDEAQQKVAEHFDGPCLVIAGPGAGKTRCLIHRVVALLARGIPDSQILAVTFTKNAAEEMNGRLDDLMENLGVRGRRPTISTFHSFGFSLLRNNGYGGYTVLKNKKTMIINVIKDLGYRTEEWLPEDVIIAIAKAKNSLMGPEEMRQQLLSDHQATSMSDFYSLYEKRKNEERVLDFDDMLYYAWKLLSSNERLRAEVRERYRYVMVDECQDNNKAQIELAQLVATKDGNLMMIGDDCQPPGTMVTVVTQRYKSLGRGKQGVPTEMKQVPIEQVREGDVVVSYDMAHSHLRRTGSVVSRVMVKPHVGELVVVRTPDGLESRYTPNHHCVVRFGDELLKKHVVYMMRRGDDYRIGITSGRMASQHKRIGVVLRANQEKADAVWILSVHDTRDQAALAEMVTAWSFGVPTLCFRASTNDLRLSQDQLDAFWSKLGSNRNAAAAALTAHRKDVNYPLWQKGEAYLQTRRPTVVRAVNLFDGMEMLPLSKAVSVDGSRVTGSLYVPFVIRHESYSGPVYSLTVENDHTYVADGIVTHNCQGIYAWRGAVPQFMLEFAERPNVEKLFLARNYRSVNVIVRAANRLIEKNTERIPKELFTQREEGVQPVIVSHRDTGAEAQWVKDQIKAGLDAGMKPKDFAVLYRSNYQSAPVEDALRKTGIPYIIYGSAPFFGRAEIMDVVAYLKLIGDPNDDDALERAYNTPPRYLGKAWWNEYRAAKGRTGDALRTLNGRFSRPYMERGARSLANDIAHLRSLKAMTPVEIIEDILDVRGTVHPDQTLQQHYERPEERGGEVVSDRAENVRELIEIARQYGTYEEFMEFIAEASTVKDKEAQLSSDTVKLMTIHRSKGLEFTWVFGVGWGEGMLPHIKSMAADKIQEERRLAYVAITRAKDKVHLSHVQEKFGRFIEPSRFLAEAFDPEVLGQLHEQMADAEAPEDVDSAEDSVVVNGPWAKKTLPRT
jgi:DNA helicase-2/ATP-dependent DNA helicase PcrA